jgi:hypothetical protein
MNQNQIKALLFFSLISVGILLGVKIYQQRVNNPDVAPGIVNNVTLQPIENDSTIYKSVKSIDDANFMGLEMYLSGIVVYVENCSCAPGARCKLIVGCENGGSFILSDKNVAINNSEDAVETEIIVQVDGKKEFPKFKVGDKVKLKVVPTEFSNDGKSKKAVFVENLSGN